MTIKLVNNLIRRGIEVIITELLATLADIEICPDFGDSRSQYLQFNTERYRSGHNGADSKSVCLNGHAGSNPALSARKTAKFKAWRFLY